MRNGSYDNNFVSEKKRKNEYNISVKFQYIPGFLKLKY